ncbi:MAG: polysaccharide deacetylase [Rhizobiaceae bacterium]|nr:polysaccharide deacetylase [Rhizobiaceae bacterium]
MSKPSDHGAVPPHAWPEEHWRSLLQRVRAGPALRPAAWKDGARCAVALSFDCDHETAEFGSGASTVGRLAWGEFGRRVGVPRILRVLKRHGVPATFFVPAVTALIDPAETRNIADNGHEIGIHGWIHENTSLLTRDEERSLLMRARDTLATLSGTEPVGHRAAQWDLSPYTIAVLREMGLLYDSSMMADEDCYELLLDGEPSGVIEVPVEWLRDDAVYLSFSRNPATRPYTTPAEVLEIFRREFDAAYEEGGLFQLVMHPFIIGYRSRIWVLEALIEHMRSRPGVWFATHADVARLAKAAPLSSHR